MSDQVRQKITGPHFRLNKSAKFLLANVIDPHARGDLRRALIKAQVEAQRQPPAKKKGDDAK